MEKEPKVERFTKMKLLQDVIAENFFLITFKRTLIFSILYLLLTFFIYFLILNYKVFKRSFSSLKSLEKTLSFMDLNYNLIELMKYNDNFEIIQSAFKLSFVVVVIIFLLFMVIKSSKWSGKEKGSAKEGGAFDRVMKALYHKVSKFNFEKEYLLETYEKLLHNLPEKIKMELVNYRNLKNQKEEVKKRIEEKEVKLSRLSEIVKKLKEKKSSFSNEEEIIMMKNINENFGVDFVNKFLLDDDYTDIILKHLKEELDGEF